MKRNSLLTFLLAVAALLSVCFTQAEVITKGGGFQLRTQPRETANFAFTNGAANPGLPLIFRVTAPTGTNHFGITTNGVPVIVNLGTNYIGYTGPIDAATAANMYFVNGLLITSNSVNRSTP